MGGEGGLSDISEYWNVPFGMIGRECKLYKSQQEFFMDLGHSGIADSYY